jgi:molecular chaperone DnaJ
MPTDYYVVLGIQRGCSEADIKQAYRKLARVYHPDVAEDKVNAETRFKEINEAYEVLSDAEKRDSYDRFGHAGVQGASAGAQYGQNMPEGFGDIFEMFFGGMRQGAGGPTGSRAAGRGSDLRYDLEISLEEAYTGVEREISFHHHANCDTCRGSGARPGTMPVTCDRCAGSGMVQSVRATPLGRFMTQSPCTKCGGEGTMVSTPCDTCRGQGRVEKRRSMTITIPAGVDDGSRIRIANNGEAGPRGGPPGDLYVYLSIAQHSVLKRDGLDLTFTLPIHFPQAALGAQIEVPLLSGSTVGIDVPAGTQSGSRIRMRGHGMPNLRGGGFGDLYVTLQVTVPTRLNKRERELLEEYAAQNTDPVDERSFFERVKDAFRPD